MTISQEFTKLKNVKSRVRKAIQTKSDLQLQDIFSTYPSFIKGITPSSFDSTGLINYCEDSDTSFTVNSSTIRDYAFYTWTNLHVLRLPSLTKVSLQGTHAFEGSNLKNIAVPASIINEYKADSNWSIYADKFIIDNMILNADTWMNSNLGNNNSNGCTFVKTIEQDNTLPVKNIIKIQITNPTTSAKASTGVFFSMAPQIGTLTKMEEGETYTYSFWAKGDTDLTLSPNAIAETQTMVSNNGFTALSNSWRRHTVTFKWTKTTKLTACFYVTIPASKTSTFYLGGLMLQKGSTMSDFVSVPVYNSTVLIEHLQNAGRTIEMIQGMTLEELITDYR